MEDHNIAPINPLPLVIWLLVVPMIVLELGFNLGSAGTIGGDALNWRLAAITDYGFRPDLWRQHLLYGDYDIATLLRFCSYAFLHSDATSAMFGVVLTLALGKFIGEIFRGWAVAAVFLAAAAVGALIYGYFVPQQLLIGAFPGVYGLIGAYSFLLWVGLAEGENPLRAFRLIGALLVIQVLYGAVFALLPLLFESMATGQADWSWIADIGGFVTGFLLSFVVSPGGFGRVLLRLRQR